MAIRLSGPLPITEIVTEFGGSTPHGLSEYYGNGSFLSPGYFPNPPALPSTGSPLNVGAFYGKSRRRSLQAVISRNTPNVEISALFSNLRDSAVATDCTLIINSGATVFGSGGAPALTVNPIFRSGDTFTLINRGNIIGQAGVGGDGGCGAGVLGKPGGGGGWGIALYASTTIFNNGTIAGGANGGAGGNGGTASSSTPCSSTVKCTACQVRNMSCATGYNERYINGYQRNSYSMQACDSYTSMGIPNNCNGNCCCGSCRDGSHEGCYHCNAQYAQRFICTNYNKVYAGSCGSTTNTCGGKGGEGAPPVTNVGLAGAPSTGGTATAGNVGGTWGGGFSIVGASFLTSPNIGGTVLGIRN